jgi:hypothetical protein
LTTTIQNLENIWQDRDFEKLMSSDALFARKFGGKHIGVVNRILNEIVK